MGGSELGVWGTQVGTGRWVAGGIVQVKDGTGAVTGLSFPRGIEVKHQGRNVGWASQCHPTSISSCENSHELPKQLIK